MLNPVAETSIRIDAPLDLVWELITDLGSYDEWNPFVVHIERPGGVLRVGARLRLHVRWADGGRTIADEIVTELDPPKNEGGRRAASFAYRYAGLLSALGAVRTTRRQWLEQASGDATYYRSREEFRGILAAFIPLTRVQEGFERHARALKTRAEALAHSGELADRNAPL